MNGQISSWFKNECGERYASFSGSAVYIPLRKMIIGSSRCKGAQGKFILITYQFVSTGIIKVSREVMVGKILGVKLGLGMRIWV